jgi:hypothetical protein
MATSALAQTGVPSADRIIRFNGSVPGASAGAETLRFAVYDEETGGNLLWEEVQTAAVDAAGSYSVFLGGTSADGLPVALFANGAPRWLSVERAGTAPGPRVLLAAVPYAVSAANATSLGGRPAADYLLTPRARAAAAASTSGAATADRDPVLLVNNGTANFIGKFFNNVDLINSQLFDNGTNVGVGTTNPLDKFHVQFTNTGGTLTGYAVQNLGSTATSFSGMLFYDHTNALRQFQGYSNGTGEYRINNISPTGSINFLIGSTSALLVDTARRVGIGQTAPTYKLDVLHGGSTGIRVQSSSSFSVVDIDASSGDAALRFVRAGVNQWNVRNRPADDYFEIFELGGGGSRMVIQNGTGNVGIGGTPNQGKLEIVGTGGTFDFGNRGILNVAGATTGSNTGTTSPSIFASDNVWANAFLAFSDARIKRVEGRSNSGLDLATLSGIEITDYTYIDTVMKGTGKQKKVIAQQLERVFPQAVNRSTGVVPDIYKLAPIHDGWVLLATDLKVGDRVRLIAGQAASVHEVREVAEGRFRTDLLTADDDEIFVYGREVKDFRIVDYEAIAMLNVSATQELGRRLEQQTAETAALKLELAELRTALATALDALNAAKNRQ